MIELSYLQTASPYVIAFLIFVMVLSFFLIGFRVRMNVIRRDPEHAKMDIKAINGMLVGMLGLLLAFTFSMANSRYDDRRHLVIEEANIIGTTILRTDIYPDSARNVLRSALKAYVERRIAFYKAGMDKKKASAEYNKAQELGAIVWRLAADYAKKDDITARTSQLIPSINEMLDIASTRLAAGVGTIPDSIMYFLFALCLAASFLLGYDQLGKIDWIVVVGFAVTLSITVFTIIDLDRPRGGLINMDGPNKKIVELIQMFNE